MAAVPEILEQATRPKAMLVLLHIQGGVCLILDWSRFNLLDKVEFLYMYMEWSFCTCTETSLALMELTYVLIITHIIYSQVTEMPTVT